MADSETRGRRGTKEGLETPTKEGAISDAEPSDFGRRERLEK